MAVLQAVRAIASQLGIAPGRCRLCLQHQAATSLGLCAGCAQTLAPRPGGYCSRCGELFEREDDPPRLCGTCRLQPPPFSGVFLYAAYEGALQEAIIQYKYHGRHAVERVLQGLLLQAYAGGCARTTQAAASATLPGHDCVVPLPLHPARLRERGFNQSLELARPLAAMHRLPLLAQGLARSRRTAPQAGFSRAERRENVRDAFVAPRPALLAGRRVLLVDDVMTTGATAGAAALACLQAGAVRVDCCVLARA
ncbi:ComF family protein [Megalodesulfovibrio gigas]|uniref:ComF family protein n=1 Tax=Megalodesulfovibrio gigas TaxID=879 RepID=UPI000401C87C|nr:ComF family protein [Megalodesulfovibrio gigas]